MSQRQRLVPEASIPQVKQQSRVQGGGAVGSGGLQAALKPSVMVQAPATLESTGYPPTPVWNGMPPVEAAAPPPPPTPPLSLVAPPPPPLPAVLERHPTDTIANS